MIHSKVYISVLILASLILSCHEDNPNPSHSECVVNESISSTDSSFYIYESGKEEYGYATAIKLNKPWRASATVYIYNGAIWIDLLTFYFLKDDPDYEYETEIVEFKFLNTTGSCLRLINDSDSLNCRAGYDALDDDVVQNNYDVIDSLNNNFIQIDTLNFESGRVAGKFMCSFKKNQSRFGKPYNPEFIRFFNGEFHCKIK
ncbi:MAG: hypothetical protein ABIO44_03515 [Saprospiraceae bacterium]